MGIHDRDYIRDEPPQGVRLRLPQSAVNTIVLINVVLWAFDWLFLSRAEPPNWLMDSMSCSAETLVNPLLWWQFFTAGFAHSPGDVMHILFNMFVLWSFGQAIEPALGKREFVCFYLVAIVIGFVLFSVRQLALDSPAHCLGASGAVTAVAMLFVFKYPNQTIYLFMVFPMKAWVAGLIMIAVDVFGARGVYVHGLPGAGIAYDVHLAGAAFAFVYFRFNWNLSRFVPNAPGEWAGNLAKSLRHRPKLRIHSPDEPQRDEKYGKLDEEGDRILEKVLAEGEESLTNEERRALEDYSRRMQQKHR